MNSQESEPRHLFLLRKSLTDLGDVQIPSFTSAAPTLKDLVDKEGSFHDSKNIIAANDEGSHLRFVAMVRKHSRPRPH